MYYIAKSRTITSLWEMNDAIAHIICFYNKSKIVPVFPFKLW